MGVEELKEQGTLKGDWVGSGAKAASSCMPAWPAVGQVIHAPRHMTVPGERARSGHLDEADSFFPHTFGKCTQPLFPAASSARWPQLQDGEAQSLSCRERGCSVRLLWSGPSARSSTAAPAHPEPGKGRPAAVCQPAGTNRTQAASALPAGHLVRALATNPVGKRWREEETSALHHLVTKGAVGGCIQACELL